ncbi:T9SS type A sorting domain-containing protein [bacterium]|nr:T9SS type A sorting domain-containing protein [bacterium]
MYVISLMLLLAMQAGFAGQMTEQKISSLDEVTRLTSMYDGWDEISDFSLTIDSNDYIAIATGYTGARVFNCEDPTNPELVFTFDEHPAYGVCFVGGALYVAAGDEGLYIYSGSASNLEYASHLDLPGFAQAADVRFASDNLCVAAGASGMHVVNVSDRFTPQLMGTYSYVHGNDAVDVSCWSNYALLANGEYGMSVVDISNPSTPTEADRYDMECNLVFASTDRAYMTTYNQASYNHLYWLNLTDPTNIGTYANILIPSDLTFTGVTGSGFAAYITTSNGQFYKMLADAQHNFTIQDSLELSTPTGVVRGTGANAYVLDSAYGFNSIDMTTFSVTGGFEADGSIYAALKYGDYAIVSAKWGGIYILDMSDPVNPVEVARFATDMSAGFMFLDGTHLWVNSYPITSCYDISDITAPVLLGEQSSLLRIYDIPFVVNNTLLTSFGPGIRMYDVSDPANIGAAVDYVLPDEANIGHIMIDDDFVYATTMSGGDFFKILDFSDPENVQLISESSLSTSPSIMRRQGDYLYMIYTAVVSQLLIVDVSDPTNPVEVSNTEISAWATLGVLMLGDYMFIPTTGYLEYDLETVVIDVSDRNNPTEIERFDTMRPYGITNFGSYLGISELNGFSIWNASDYLTIVENGAGSAIPIEFAIESVYPNPFNPSTTITLSLAAMHDVQVKVYDIQGRQVADLFTGKMNPGYHTLQFDGKNLASDVYFVEAVAGGQKLVQRITLVK